MIKLFCYLLAIHFSLAIQAQSGHIIKTPYNFSVTIPANWGLLSKAEIAKEQQKANQNLIMPALAYLGNKKYLDDIPHIYVIFYPQPKIAEKGFAKSCKIFLSDTLRSTVQKELSQKYPKWTFNINKNEYYVDTTRRLIMFTSNTKYEDGSTTVVLYCYFLMETGAAEVHFSFNAKIIDNYADVINGILDSVEIDSSYLLKKD